MTTALPRLAMFLLLALPSVVLAAAPATVAVIKRCEGPLRIELEVREGGAPYVFNGAACSGGEGNLELDSEVPPEHVLADDPTASGRYVWTGSRLAVDIELARHGQPVQRWSRADVPVDGTVAALKPVDATASAQLQLSARPRSQAGAVQVDAKLPPADMARRLAAAVGMRVDGLELLPVTPKVIFKFTQIDVHTLLTLISDDTGVELWRFSADHHAFVQVRDRDKADDLFERAQALEAGTPERIMLLEQLRTLSRPQDATDRPPSAVSALRELAQLYQHRGDLDQSVAAWQDLLAHTQLRDADPGSLAVAYTRAMLGAALLRRGDERQAAGLLQLARRPLLEHPDYTDDDSTPFALLPAYAAIDDTEVAEQLWEQGWRQVRYLHSNVAASLGDLAAPLLASYQRQGRTEQIEALLDRWAVLLLVYDPQGGGNNPYTPLRQAGLQAFESGEFARCIATLGPHLDLLNRLRPPPTDGELLMWTYLTGCQLAVGDLVAAARSQRAVAGLRRAADGADDPDSVQALRELQVLLRAADLPVPAQWSDQELPLPIASARWARRVSARPGNATAHGALASWTLASVVLPTLDHAREAQASSADPSSPVALLEATALLQLGAGRSKQARAAFKHAQRLRKAAGADPVQVQRRERWFKSLLT